jgi:hypothetical protein
LSLWKKNHFIFDYIQGFLKAKSKTPLMVNAEQAKFIKLTV